MQHKVLPNNPEEPTKIQFPDSIRLFPQNHRARLCRYSLLILDDFGMERGTDYGLEQVYNVIDSRYRSGKPLIVTTNLSLDELQHPQDTPHARIYDRLLEMCAPILFTGTNFRRQTAQSKLDRLKTMMKEKECL